MLPCRRILAATDFSDASFEALKVADELAVAFSAELLLVHVRHSVPWPPDVLAVPGFDLRVCERQLADDARLRLAEVGVTRVSPEVRKRLVLKKGDPGHEILHIAESEAVDLIVIATHGMSSWHHYVHGAVAQRVIHDTPCAVLVVRSPLKRRRAQDAGGKR